MLSSHIGSRAFVAIHFLTRFTVRHLRDTISLREYYPTQVSYRGSIHLSFRTSVYGSARSQHRAGGLSTALVNLSSTLAMSYSRLTQNLAEPRGTSSAVASVLFTRGGDHHQVTKSGSYIYHGDAANFHEWEFRTRLRVKTAGTDPERYAEVMSKVVNGLRGDAFTIAKEVGLERLWQAGQADSLDDMGSEDTTVVAEAGVDVLIRAIRSSVFPLTTYEAKELFRQYCKPSGSLSR